MQKAFYSTLLPNKTIRAALKESSAKPISVTGWIRSVRKQKQFSFATVNDGSSLKGIQAILNNKDTELLTTGACVQLTGQLIDSPGKEQEKELQVSEVKVLGLCDNTYPLQKKRHTNEFLRSQSHLRMRGNTSSSVLRVRNTATQGIHSFFGKHEFIQTHTPILTSNDCEGAGEVFQLNKSEEFFKKPVYLTVSGQLHAETMASSMSRVYTFGPTFRAEESLTSRHLAEFWMVEAEVAFVSLPQLLDVAEANIQETTRHVIQNCAEEMEFFNKWIDKGIIEKLDKSINKPFVRMSYTEAVDLLSKHKFTFPIKWGSSLQSEHEKFLAAHCDQPVFVTDYPKELKPFYMRANEDNKTVGCFDLLMPGLGELVGGSMREERHDILEANMKKANMNLEEYQWYLDLRKYGSAPHGGYGIGFERLMLWLTGIENVREVIPMPRWFGHCKY
ncbi:asparaginyl-tRNA synthetase [Sporodiniella umbellata]|nr:asparaginyl-tRNA synthetase [Sporodiniella umbellata]